MKVFSYRNLRRFNFLFIFNRVRQDNFILKMTSCMLTTDFFSLKMCHLLATLTNLVLLSITQDI